MTYEEVLNPTERCASAVGAIVYLANAIDAKLEKIESCLTKARKAHLEGQLTALTAAFEKEYAAFLASTRRSAEAK